LNLDVAEMSMESRIINKTPPSRRSPATRIATDKDRTAFIPAHRGIDVLPNGPLFSRLLRYAHRRPQRVAVKDVNAGIEKTHIQLLTDVLALRRAIELMLNPSILVSLRNGDDVYMSILAPGGYEYTVAFLAILALGAAAVPLSE